MRKIFIEELILEARKNKKIFLVVNDLGYGVVEKFANLFPKQFINAGVAEQNMMGVAAGLAMDNNQVFVYSIGNFPTFRCAEQIRNDIDYHKLPVTIVNVGAGVSYGSLGYSHHSLQDYSLMRSMPNILISSPISNDETSLSVKYLLKNPQPSYLRLSKQNIDDKFLLKKTSKLTKPGIWVELKKGDNKKAILTTGNTYNLLKKIIIKKKYKDFSVYSIPLWGMKYKYLQFNQIKKFNTILTIEDHFQDGGFGSWLRESIMDYNLKIDFRSLYLNKNIVGQVGSEEFLQNKYMNKI